MRTSTVPSKIERQIRQMRSNGHTFREIAQETGYSESTCCKIARKIKMTQEGQSRYTDKVSSPVKRLIPHDLKHHIIECHKKGVPVKCIAEKCGVAKSTIYSIIKANELDEKRDQLHDINNRKFVSDYKEAISAFPVDRGSAVQVDMTMDFEENKIHDQSVAEQKNTLTREQIDKFINEIDADIERETEESVKEMGKNFNHLIAGIAIGVLTGATIMAFIL